MPYANNMKGFSTLFVVIILGGIAVSLAVMLSTSSVWSIRGSRDATAAATARSLTNACAEVAIEAIRENNAYIGSDTVILGGDTCTYTVTNTGASNRTITVTGSVANSISKVQINTDAFNPIHVVSWQETP